MTRQPHVGLGLLIVEVSRSHSARHTTVGRTPLDEGSARRRDFYLTEHNNHKRQTSMPPAGFEPAIPAGERPQIHALDRGATGIGNSNNNIITVKLTNSLDVRNKRIRYKEIR